MLKRERREVKLIGLWIRSSFCRDMWPLRQMSFTNTHYWPPLHLTSCLPSPLVLNVFWFGDRAEAQQEAACLNEAGSRWDSGLCEGRPGQAPQWVPFPRATTYVYPRTLLIIASPVGERHQSCTCLPHLPFQPVFKDQNSNVVNTAHRW